MVLAKFQRLRILRQMKRKSRLLVPEARGCSISRDEYQSPCLTCENKNEEKSIRWKSCVEKCERLQAFQEWLDLQNRLTRGQDATFEYGYKSDGRTVIPSSD